MNKSLVIAGALSLCLSAGLGVVAAGPTFSYPVSIGASNASGSLGTARNSADTLQLIGCNVYTSYEPPVAYCVARNAAGTWASCQTTAAKYVDAASSIGSDSLVSFTWSGGTCTSINVSHHSYLEPKQ